MNTGAPTAAELDWQPLATGLQFPEGPLALGDGSVLVVEIKRGTLTRIQPDGTATVIAHCGGGPNGAALGPGGEVFVCNNGGFEWYETHGLTIPTVRARDYGGGRIQVVNLSSGFVRDLYIASGDAPLRGPNDLIFDAHGGFYFTDTGKHDAQGSEYGSLHYARADGSGSRCLVGGLHQPNGCALAPGGGRLYFTETLTARAWYYDVAQPGVIRGGATAFAPGEANFLYGSPRYEGFDSMALEASGNLCIATLFGGCITVLSPDGQLLQQVRGPGDPGITNLCFSPLDPHVAYVTASCTGVLYRVRWPRAGLPVNR